MPQRFESTQSQDALEHSVQWPVTESGQEVEFEGSEVEPSVLLEVLEEYWSELSCPEQ